MKRLYQFDSVTGTFQNADSYYSKVVANPKANARIRKKAVDILKDCAAINGWAQLHRAAKDEMTLDEFLVNRRLRRYKRNIGLKRRHCNVPNVTAFNRYVEYAKWTACD